MRKVIAIATFIMLPLTAVAGDIFPKQPAPMGPGYGSNGAGLHSAVPNGRPGEDCAINPVSFDRTYIEETTTRFVAGDIISIPTTVLFDFDGDIVRPKGLEDLGNVFDLLTEAGVTELEVVGHTDAKGTEAYNEDLGLRRAAAVALVLTGLGFDNIEVGTGGELEPVAPNTHPDGSDNPEGRQQNRRVDIEVTSVRDVEIEETQLVREARNPQVFHVMSAGNTVNCGVDPQNREALFWGNGSYIYPSYNGGRRFGSGRIFP